MKAFILVVVMLCFAASLAGAEDQNATALAIGEGTGLANVAPRPTDVKIEKLATVTDASIGEAEVAVKAAKPSGGVVEKLATITNLAVSESEDDQVSSGVIKIEGAIIDNKCAMSQNPGALGEFILTHTKACATMPQCAASGYSIYSDGRLMKFDAISNVKVEEFLRWGDSRLDVDVKARETPDGLSLISIKNRK